MFKGKESCPSCGSRDNVAVWLDDDGRTRKKCFSTGCDWSEGYGQGGERTELVANYTPVEMPADAQHVAITGRRINLDVSRFYDVRYSASTTSLIFPYKRLGVVTGYKGRNVSLPKSDPGHFYVKGKVSKQLFGLQCLKNKEQRTKRLAITFGEMDVLATYQMLGIPAVCAQNDSASVEAIRANLEELESMDAIYLIPDSDVSSLGLVQQITDLLEVECRVVNLRLHKDPNDYLMAGHIQEFRDEFYSAEVAPRNYVVRGDDLLEAGLRELKANNLGTFIGCTPIDLGIGGIRPSELSFVLGSPFAGKSTFTHYLTWKCLVSGFKVLYLSIEERAAKATANIMRASSSVPLSPHDGVDKLLQNIGDLSNLSVWKDTEELTPELLERRLKQAARCDGVQVVFIDNLTAISGGTEGQWASMNDYIMATRRVTSTRGLSVWWVVHTRRGEQASTMEAGYGTSFIEKLADNLLGTVRLDEPDNGVQVPILKCRALGKYQTFQGTYTPGTVDYAWDSGVSESPTIELVKENLNAQFRVR